MNGADYVILALLLLGTVAGFARGFIVQVATILGAVLGLMAARVEYVPVRHLLRTFLPASPWLTVVAFLLIFLVVWGAIVTVATKVRSLARILLLGGLDRLGGALLGAIQSALVIELLLYLAKRAPNHALHTFITHSKLAPAFLHAVPVVDKLFPHIPK